MSHNSDLGGTSNSPESQVEDEGGSGQGEDGTAPEKKKHAIPLHGYFSDPTLDAATKYVQGGMTVPSATELAGRIYRPKEGELISHDPNNETRKTLHTEAAYLSFGDGGTTATVTEWGQQMQISRYLGHGESGIDVIDHAYTPEPYEYSKRSQSLLDMPDTGQIFGVDTGLPDFEWDHTTYWLRNKWPRVVFKSKGRWELTLQWAVQDNVVIQQIFLQNFTNETLDVGFWIILNVLIRELDFASSSHAFNKESFSPNYAEGPGPGGYGFVKLHVFPRQEKDQSDNEKAASKSSKPGECSKPDAVAAVVGVFENGKGLTKKDLDEKSQLTIGPRDTLHLVAGYKLVLLSKQKQDWRRLVLTKNDLDIDNLLHRTQLERSIPQDAFLFNQDFYVGRNLENILSVCAIPITGVPIWDYDNAKTPQQPDQKDEERTVALTCGDMAGHRICVSASYFAFKFLLEVCRDLGKDHPLRARIKQTCLAHLRWVFKTANRKDSGEFARYYWVNGERILDYLPDGPSDTPFQILKAYEFFRFIESPVEVEPIEKTSSSEAANEAGPKQPTAGTSLNESRECNGENEEAEKNEIRNLLNKNNKDIAMKWVEALDKANKRDSFTWPHSTRTGMNYFRLDDHVWIWNTIKAISLILRWDASVTISSKNRKNQRRSSVRSWMNIRDEDSWSYQWNHLMRKYDPDKVKREIIQRFTTVHDGSKERILAVTRSPRETRFEFHSRDTALFYRIVDTMIEPEERWLNLVKSQERFASTEDTEPDNSLRHGLRTFVANSSGTSSTERKGFQDAERTLTASMFTNGLFPGQMTSSEEAEYVHYREDHLLHVSFEIPYLLYTTRRLECSFTETNPESHTSNKARKKKAMKPIRTLDGTIPFNDQIDVKSITDLTEEWLYNYPFFLDWKPSDTHISLSLSGLKDERDRIIRGNWSLAFKPFGRRVSRISFRETPNDGGEREGKSDEFDTLITAFGSRYGEFKPSLYHYEPPKTEPHDQKHVIIDIEKRARKTSSSDNPESRTQTLVNSWEKLRTLRTAHNAKKRFLWCRNPSEDYALMCYIASPEDEQPLLRSFFNRHAKCFTDFDDKTSRAYNTWETEFHCSFLQLHNKGHDLEKAENENKGGSGLDLILHPSTRRLPKLDGKQLGRSSMSFRFYGDFFDRFWTCHYVESYLGEPPKSDMDHYLSGESRELKRLFKDRFAYVWQQRKILEQVLFHLIISEINTSTQMIITKIQRKLIENPKDNDEMKTTTLSNYNSRLYFDKLETWAALHEILEFLGDDLDNILSNVKSWNSREQDRRTEKPRWTNNDEKKYRDAINRALLECQRAERVLLAHRATVRSLSKTLSYRREEAKNEYDRHMSQRNFRNSDNVKYFTYSSVIFLPLGFASSVYSMQAAPPTDVLQHMVIFSVVALLVLLVIIYTLPLLLKRFTKFYRDLKELYQFWKLFYTKVSFSFSDLFTMQIPSFILLLKGQSFNPVSSSRREHAEKQKARALKPPESFGSVKKTLRKDTRAALSLRKSQGEYWVQSWNRIIEPWNRNIRGDG